MEPGTDDQPFMTQVACAGKGFVVRFHFSYMQSVDDGTFSPLRAPRASRMGSRGRHGATSSAASSGDRGKVIWRTNSRQLGETLPMTPDAPRLLWCLGILSSGRARPVDAARCQPLHINTSDSD